MTKTLTEQWREGTLDGGIYYLLLRDGTTVTDKTIYIVGEKQFRWHFSSFDFVKEVIKPVPSYDEYKRLQEQISEANKLILWCARISWTGDQREDIFDKYLSKWGVK